MPYENAVAKSAGNSILEKDTANHSASIIILTFNGLKYTRLCVESLFRYTGAPFEVIILDQGSRDGTVDYLRELQSQHSNVKIVAKDRNIGFAAGCNQAAELATGDVLVFLNNDVIVSSGWFEGLMGQLVSDPDLAASGPRSNATGELQFDAYSVEKIRKIPEDIDSYANDQRRLMAGKVWYFHRLAGFCLAVRKKVFSEVGGFDQRLTFFEDDDLCYRIMRRAYKLAIIPSVFVYHFGSSTFKALRSNIDVLLQINRNKFLWSTTRPELDGQTGNSPLVSVITTTFNRPRELEAAVQSICDQTYSNWEAIIVNDGGDDVSHMIERFHDRRLRYINAAHVGRSEALNIGIGHATGKYLAYLDDDDIWYPEHLELCAKFLERNPSIGVVYTRALRKNFRMKTDGTREVLDQYIDHAMEFDWARLLCVNWIPNLSVMYRRALLQQVGNFRDLAILEDWDLLLRLSSVSEFAHLPVVTGEYYIDVSRESRNERLRKSNPKLYFEIVNQIRWSQRAAQTSERIRFAAEQFAKSGDHAQSLKLNTLALQYNPFNFWVLISFVHASHASGVEAGLVKPLQCFLSERPDKGVIWKFYAQELIKKEQYVNALRALEMALLTRETEGDASEVYRLMSICYSEMGMSDTAIACHLKSNEPAQSAPLLDALPPLPEGPALDQQFQTGLFATPLKGLTYFYLYSRRWGTRRALRKILRHLRSSRG